MSPPPPSRSSGSAAWVQYRRPSRFTSIMRRQCSVSASSTRPRSITPALLTSASRPPRATFAPSAAAARAIASPMPEEAPVMAMQRPDSAPSGTPASVLPAVAGLQRHHVRHVLLGVGQEPVLPHRGRALVVGGDRGALVAAGLLQQLAQIEDAGGRVLGGRGRVMRAGAQDAVDV